MNLCASRIPWPLAAKDVVLKVQVNHEMSNLRVLSPSIRISGLSENSHILSVLSYHLSFLMSSSATF